VEAQGLHRYRLFSVLGNLLGLGFCRSPYWERHCYASTMARADVLMQTGQEAFKPVYYGLFSDGAGPRDLMHGERMKGSPSLEDIENRRISS
jgi:hypothetical protein